jgi:hypothetical protein
MPEALGIQNYFMVGEDGLIEELPNGETHFHGVVLLRCRAEAVKGCVRRY